MTSNAPEQATTQDGADPADAPAAYRVLARKYRPSRFEDLIGQQPMVRTLRNAFEHGRIAQGYMLTGVRGVGKTTTARILARALNYEPKEGGESAGPTLDLDARGRHCAAILESRHVDVMEMDAASHTSVDNVRDIIDAVQYRPLEARYKVYIIDEVHMLSKAAFNALLKTLEEPPEHVKFIFATTEIRKVPITVLSRCQRFDLRRVEADELIGHLRNVVGQEGVSAEDEALAMVARAAEGSVRDALSILDQAIAHGGGTVAADALRDMLGVADRALVADLFEALMRGDIAGALTLFDKLYGEGADPSAVLGDLASFTHLVTRMKAIPDASADASLSEDERTRGAAFAQGLTMGALNRAWQILFKGLEETQAATRPRAAADMVLIRLAHAASLPDPEEAARILRGEGGEAAAPAPPRAAPAGNGAHAMADAPAPSASALAAVPTSLGGSGPLAERAGLALAAAQPEPQSAPDVAPAAEPVHLARFEDVPALASKHRDPLLKSQIEKFVRLVRFDPPRIEFALEEGAPPTLVQDIGARLSEWTGERWIVILSREPGDLPLRAQREHAERAEMDEVHRDAVVAAVLQRFPGARVEAVRTTEEINTRGLAAADGEEPEFLPPADDDSDEDGEFV